jgi:hypothetical protein
MAEIITDFPGRQIAQSRPSSSSATSLYAIPNHYRTEIRKIIVCNTSANVATFRIFHDVDGAIYTEATALFWDIPIDPGETIGIEEQFWMDGKQSGNLAVKSSEGNALTYTIYGAEEKVK